MNPVPHNKPFSRLLRQTRRDINRSQQEIAEAIGVRQNTISSWERGVQLPSPRGGEAGKVVALAKALDIDPEELLAHLVEQVGLDEAHPSLGLNQQSYHEEIDAYLNHVGHDQVAVWVLVGDRFPAIDQVAIRDAWINNIRQGTTYHLVWFIDLLEPTTLDRTARTLWEIAARTRTAFAERPGLVHYPTTSMFSVEPKPAQFDEEDKIYLKQIRENWDLYQELAVEEVPKNQFKPFHYVNLRTRRGLVEHLSCNGPMELYLPRHRRIHPLSSLCIRQGRSEQRGPAEPVWILQDDDATYAMRDAVQQFEAEHRKAKAIPGPG